MIIAPRLAEVVEPYSQAAERVPHLQQKVVGSTHLRTNPAGFEGLRHAWLGSSQFRQPKADFSMAAGRYHRRVLALIPVCDDYRAPSENYDLDTTKSLHEWPPT